MMKTQFKFLTKARRVGALTILLASVGPACYADASCLPLDDRPRGWSVRVSSPGNYCLKMDLKQSVPLVRLPHQPAPSSPLLLVAAANAQIDLGNHELVGEGPSAQGLWVNGNGDMRTFSVAVRNGTIRTAKQPVVFMVYTWNSKNKRFRKNYGASALAVADGLDEYVTTGFVLEDLTLQASEVAVVMQGRGNVIRRCKIIGGNGVVNLYGPGTIFEDNEVVLDASEIKSNGEPPVALYLEDGQGAVVRNNRFTITGRVAEAEAIVLKNSAGVLIEGNVINGREQRYRLLDQASSIKVLQ